MTAELDARRRAVQAMLRLTERELVRAEADARTAGVVPQVLAARGKARLTVAKLARANALIKELLAIFGGSSATRGRASELYALTLVLTRSRDANRRTP